MQNIFYIPINSNSLAHYFSKALILPSQYFQNKPEDIQNKLESSILLSIKKWVKNSDCSIEVILTENELNELKSINENFLSLSIPLPISRIRKIHFLDAKQMETTLWNINNGAAFIPQHLVSISNVANIDFHDDYFSIKENTNHSKNEIEKKVSRFDTALGGFAFMKVGGKDLDGISMEYSENYFITLSHFNKLIEAETLKAEKEKHLSFNRRYIDLFTTNNSEWSKWHPYIYKNVELRDVEEIAIKNNIRLERKLGLLNLDSIDKQTHLYDIAILATYGDRKNKSVDDLISNLHNGLIPENKMEDISLLFGLHIGYGKLRNKYKTSKNEYNVKFKLDSKLDYYTIESIYQFAFNNNKNNFNFNFIDEWNIQTNKNKIVGFETYVILDKTIIAKKKRTALEVFVESSSMGIYETLSNSLKQWLPNFATLDNKAAIKYFQDLLKNDLSSSISNFETNIINNYQTDFNNEKQSLISKYENYINNLHTENTTLKNEISNLRSINKNKVANQREVELIITNKVEEVDNDTVPVESKIDYNELSLPDLKKIAKDLKIRGYSNKNKEELIILIKNTPPAQTLL